MQLLEAKNPKDPKQSIRYLQAQDSFRFSPSHVTYFAGGWGAGKSIGGIGFCEVSMFMNPGCVGIIVEPEYKMLRDFINNKFKPAFRNMIIRESKQDNEIHMKRGIVIKYLSGHDTEKLEQYEAAWLFADEVGLMNGELLSRAVARVRDPKARRLRIGFAGTPHWGWLSDAFQGRDDANRRIIHVSTDDNPYIPQEYKDNLLSSCPASMAQAYINGFFVPPGGSVYPEYDPVVHGVDWTYRQDLDTGVAIDWGPRSPHALLFQIVPKGLRLYDGTSFESDTLVVFDEVFYHGENNVIRTEDFCKKIMAKGYRFNKACADPAGEGVEATSGLDQIYIAQPILGVKIDYTRSQRLRNIKNGIEHVSRMLTPAKGKPTLYLANSMMESKDPRSLHNALRAYSYPKGKDGKPLDTNPDKDGITDDACDCLRYIAINYFPIMRLQAHVRSIA